VDLDPDDFTLRRIFAEYHLSKSAWGAYTGG